MLGSQDEIEDVKVAYDSSSGNLPSILASIPHSSHIDEPRLVTLIDSLIRSGELQSTKKWEKSSKDKAAQEKRKKQGEKEAKEAEMAAKELGVWEEFYGSGGKGKRKGDDKGKANGKGSGEDGLAALILKRQKDREGGLDALADKYAKMEEDERAKKKAKRGKGKKEGVNGTKEMTDEEFAALQAKMFGDKDQAKDKKGRA